jgi:hypothetical protein
MDTSDDPGIVTWPFEFDKIFGAGGPTNPPSQPTTFIQGEETLDFQKRQKRRQRLASSVMTKEWDEPILGQTGLLGIG